MPCIICNGNMRKTTIDSDISELIDEKITKLQNKEKENLDNINIYNEKLNMLEGKIKKLLESKNVLTDNLNQLNYISVKSKNNVNEKKEIKNEIKEINTQIKFRKNNIYMVKKEQKYLLTLNNMVLWLENKLKDFKYITSIYNNVEICIHCNSLLNNTLDYKTNIDFMVEANMEYKPF